jgi:hypothetical protein
MLTVQLVRPATVIVMQLTPGEGSGLPPTYTAAPVVFPVAELNVAPLVSRVHLHALVSTVALRKMPIVALQVAPPGAGNTALKSICVAGSDEGVVPVNRAVVQVTGIVPVVVVTVNDCVPVLLPWNAVLADVAWRFDADAALALTANTSRAATAAKPSFFLMMILPGSLV